MGDLEAADAEDVRSMFVALFPSEHHFFVCSLRTLAFLLRAGLLTA
jgi:hypothetical protein